MTVLVCVSLGLSRNPQWTGGKEKGCTDGKMFCVVWFSSRNKSRRCHLHFVACQPTDYLAFIVLICTFMLKVLPVKWHPFFLFIIIWYLKTSYIAENNPLPHLLRSLTKRKWNLTQRTQTTGSDAHREISLWSCTKCKYSYKNAQPTKIKGWELSVVEFVNHFWIRNNSEWIISPVWMNWKRRKWFVLPLHAKPSTILH